MSSFKLVKCHENGEIETKTASLFHDVSVKYPCLGHIVSLMSKSNCSSSISLAIARSWLLC